MNDMDLSPDKKPPSRRNTLETTSFWGRRRIVCNRLGLARLKLNVTQCIHIDVKQLDLFLHWHTLHYSRTRSHTNTDGPDSPITNRSQAVARIADRTASQHLWGSREVIGHVTIWYSMISYWWSFGRTKPLSLTVSEIFNVQCNAVVDVTLIRPLNKGQGHRHSFGTNRFLIYDFL